MINDHDGTNMLLIATSKKGKFNLFCLATGPRWQFLLDFTHLLEPASSYLLQAKANRLHDFFQHSQQITLLKGYEEKVLNIEGQKLHQYQQNKQ